MKGIYKNNPVEVLKVITNISLYIKYPMVVQVKIKHQDGTIEYVDGNDVEFMEFIIAE